MPRDATVGYVARPPRLDVPDGIFHTWSRGNERRPIFRDDADFRGFLELLGVAVARYRWRVLTYCLMTNHYHLLLQTLEPTLSRGMRQLNGVYAQSFNRRHGRVGHLFQGRFGALLVQDDEHFLTEVAYIVRNPLRTSNPVQPADWPWSSHRAALDLEPPPPFFDVDCLLTYFGPTRAEARERYRACVEETDEPPASHPLADGDDEFVARHVASVPPDPEFPRRYCVVSPPPLGELVRDRDDVSAVAAAHLDHGYSMRQIATHLGCGTATISRRIRAHEGATRET
jgi:REP element-mobilizing transposase RayT